MGCPPPATTDATANCADPAKVDALMAIAGSAPMPPVETDRTPNEIPNSPTAMASGMAVTAPRLSSNRIGGGESTGVGC